ncbi:BBP7 family outer membrane beta-barrel protein [Blastopirellula marina]|nr:BBP7 family outer membrane beta-barrel protein [Blastopirellula marina]
MQPPGMMPQGYGPSPMMGPAPYAQMAAAPDYGQVSPVSYDPSMYEPVGDYVEYENYAGAGYDSCGDGGALPPRAYGGVEAMMVWRKGGNYPPLLTTSANADRGILGNPSTQIVWGDGNEHGNPTAGGRITLGLWLDDYQNWSVGGRFMALEEQSQGFTATSDQYPVLAYPFFNLNTGLQDSTIVALPGTGTGAANNTTVNFENRNSFYMGDAFLTKHIATNNGNRWDFIGGYTYFKMEDSLYNDATFTVQDLAPPGGLSTGDVVRYSDRFDAVNEFHGGHVGLMAEFQDGPFSWRAMGKLALGSAHQEATVSGLTTANGNFVRNEGVYALASNSGSFSRDKFVYVPEINIEMLYAYNCNLDFKIGTTFIYFSDIVTGGALINNNIDPNGTAPVFQFNEQEYWILGMTAGVEYHY